MALAWFLIGLAYLNMGDNEKGENPYLPLAFFFFFLAYLSW